MDRECTDKPSISKGSQAILQRSGNVTSIHGCEQSTTTQHTCIRDRSVPLLGSIGEESFWERVQKVSLPKVRVRFLSTQGTQNDLDIHTIYPFRFQRTTEEEEAEMKCTFTPKINEYSKKLEVSALAMWGKED